MPINWLKLHQTYQRAAALSATSQPTPSRQDAEREQILGVTKVCSEAYYPEKISDFLFRGLTVEQARQELEALPRREAPAEEPAVKRTLDDADVQAIYERRRQEAAAYNPSPKPKEKSHAV